MEREEANVQVFLAGLSALSEKYQIYIGGGCNLCDSPYLYINKGKNDTDYILDNLIWNGEKYEGY